VLSRASDKTISVNYRAADIRTQAGGLATPHLDYTPTSGNLIFRPGELRKTITVNTLTDSVEDENEVIDIILSQPVNAALGLATGAVLGAPLPPLRHPEPPASKSSSRSPIRALRRPSRRPSRPLRRGGRKSSPAISPMSSTTA